MKTFFLIDLIFGILILIGFISINVNDEINGVIKNINYGNAKTTIYVENSDVPIIIFEKINLDISEGDNILAVGKFDTYRMNKQLIAELITAN